MNPALYIGALSATWTHTYYSDVKPSEPVEVPLWFICWLSFLLGVNIGMLIILLTSH